MEERSATESSFKEGLLYYHNTQYTKPYINNLTSTIILWTTQSLNLQITNG